MRNTIASQHIRHNLSRFTMVIYQKSPRETLSSSSVTTRPEKCNDHLAILVNSPSQLLLFTTYLHNYLVEVGCIAEFLMPTLQASGIFGAKIVTPQAN